jgi:cytoskeletal protein CcmA (bactofilin family)
MFSKLKGNPQENDPVARDAAAAGLSPAAAETPRPRAQSTAVPGVLTTSQKPAIVSEQFTIRGDIDSDGTLHVEGRVIGVVKANTIHISATGHIEGDVICQNLTVKGRVDGKVVCQDLTIAASARVRGHVSYHFITVGSGARVECEMVIASPAGTAG